MTFGIPTPPQQPCRTCGTCPTCGNRPAPMIDPPFQYPNGADWTYRPNLGILPYPNIGILPSIQPYVRPEITWGKVTISNGTTYQPNTDWSALVGASSSQITNPTESNSQ